MEWHGLLSAVIVAVNDDVLEVVKTTHMQFLAARSRWTNLRLDR